MPAGLVSGEMSSWLADGHLLFVPSHGLSFMHLQRERSSVSSSSYKGTHPIRIGTHPYDLI